MNDDRFGARNDGETVRSLGPDWTRRQDQRDQKQVAPWRHQEPRFYADVADVADQADAFRRGSIPFSPREDDPIRPHDPQAPPVAWACPRLPRSSRQPMLRR